MNGNHTPETVTGERTEPGSLEDLEGRARFLLLSIGIREIKAGDKEPDPDYSRKLAEVVKYFRNVLGDVIEHDEKIPKLINSLIQIKPLLEQMQTQARTNLTQGRNPEIALATNRLVKDVLESLALFKDK